MKYIEFHQNYLDLNLDFVGYESTLPNFSFGPARRENYVIHYIVSGCGLFRINGADYDLKSGDCFILPAEVETFYQASSNQPWTYQWIGISGRIIGDLMARTSLEDRDWCVKNVRDTDFINQFHQIQTLAYGHSSCLDLTIQSALFSFMASLLTAFPQVHVQKRNQADTYAEKAYTFINNHYQLGIKIKDVLAHVMISRTYLFTIFKAKYGLSPQKYLIDLRLGQATMLLVHSENTISQISEAVGFTDALSFSNAFKKRYGTSPRNFRKTKYEHLLLETISTLNLNRIKKTDKPS